jgi:sulfur relay (sulfurtransferase) DsrC/TusE family protein
MKNKEHAKERNFQAKLKRSVQETKSRLMKKKEKHFMIKVKETLRKVLIHKERTLISQVPYHWIILKTLTDWLKHFKIKYIIKKIVKHRTSKLLGVLLFYSAVIGKCYRKLYCILL